MSIKVMIVDDHALIREGIKRLLSDNDNLNIIATVDSGEAAIAEVKHNRPDVILMDVRMPGMDGLEAIRKILRIDASIKILALTAQVEEPYPTRVLQAGAQGYITKDTPCDEMITAIQAAHQGKRYLSQEVAQAIALGQFNENGDNPFKQLSEREMQVTEMIINGKKAPEIANKLFVSAKTVNTYRYRIFEKLDIKSDVDLTHLAIRYGLIEA